MMRYTFVFFAMMATSTLAINCGKPTVDMLPSGEPVEVAPGSHPWVVSIVDDLYGYGGEGHVCTGVLLNSGSDVETDVVLATASCIAPVMSYYAIEEEPLAAVIGLQDLDSPEQGQKIKLSNPIFSPFNIGRHTGRHSTQYNFAIMRLATPIKFSSTVQPVCLPQPNEIIPDGTPATLAYYHLNGGQEKDFPSRPLMQVGFTTATRQDVKECKNNYITDYTAFDHTQNNATLCAHTLDSDAWKTCKSDKSGPLVVKTEQGYVLHGLAFIREGCLYRPNDEIGVFVNVASNVGPGGFNIDGLSKIMKEESCYGLFKAHSDYE